MIHTRKVTRRSEKSLSRLKIAQFCSRCQLQSVSKCSTFGDFSKLSITSINKSVNVFMLASCLSEMFNPVYIDSEEAELERLLALITVCPSKQQLPSLEAHVGESTEARALENFSKKYEDVRNFQAHEYSRLMEKIFSGLVKYRLCNDEWIERAPAENHQRVMTVMRIMMRDSTFQKMFVFKLDGLKTLCKALSTQTDHYLEGKNVPNVVRTLIEMTNIIQKLARVEEFRDHIVDYETHCALASLLWAHDTTLLHCSLYALCDLAQSEKPRSCLCELNFIEQIMLVLQDYDLDSKRHAAKLLKFLCANAQFKEMVKVYDGIPLLLSLLNATDLKLLRYVVWCINQLAEDVDTSDELRRHGVIPLLISHLYDRKYSNHSDVTAPASATLSNRTNPSLTNTDDESYSLVFSEEIVEQVCLMKVACCAALTELIRHDHNSQQIVTNNGVYALGMLILPDAIKSKASETLQKNALRTLRFLFSLEGNRRRFKRIFQNSHVVFTAFIDVGHYVHTIDKYQSVVDKLNNLSASELAELRENIETTNQQREVTQHVEDYAVLELLGAGSFGSVSKVRKRNSGQTFYALKEVNLNMIGKTAKDQSKSTGEIISEINIVKDQMKHPNIVKYYRTFTIDNKLYIVMELIDGAPLSEHFNSLKEKQDNFTEARIWNVFIQVVLALRYLHKEKHIVHRDLSPNNIMLCENDHVTITDFGLAKHKQMGENGYLKSRVGTLNYSCPEIVQDLPYGEKADIWAIGCILYQMCTLIPPFHTTNMLALASKIVSGEYAPLQQGSYSCKIKDTIARCLTVDPQSRPDIVGVASFIAEQMMAHLENVRGDNRSLERKLEKERKRTQRHYSKATNYMQSYQKLFIASQERYDRLANSQNGLHTGDTLPCGFRYDTNGNVEKGGISGDDEEEPSSSDSNGSASSLRLGFSRPPKPPSSSTRRKLDFNNNLEVSIPPVNGSNGNRDSGISSAGEPSPNHDLIKPVIGKFHRSFSSPGTENKKRQRSGSKGRPGSNSGGAATLTISPRKVRQISDPIQQILNVLHKVIYITQLPPTLMHNPRRSIIDKFKRSLFSPTTNSANLKVELKKLANGSQELIDINFCNTELNGASLVSHKRSPSLGHENGLETDIANGISYEQLLSIIETVLRESDYYAMPLPQARRNVPSLTVDKSAKR